MPKRIQINVLIGYEDNPEAVKILEQIKANALSYKDSVSGYMLMAGLKKLPQTLPASRSPLTPPAIPRQTPTPTVTKILAPIPLSEKPKLTYEEGVLMDPLPQQPTYDAPPGKPA